MTASILRAEAAIHDRDADFHAAAAARYAGHAAHYRKVGDVERAREFEIMRDAAGRCEELAAFRAFGCRLAAARLEHHAARTAALFAVGRAA